MEDYGMDFRDGGRWKRVSEFLTVEQAAVLGNNVLETAPSAPAGRVERLYPIDDPSMSVARPVPVIAVVRQTAVQVVADSGCPNCARRRAANQRRKRNRKARKK